jgi:hypothetical protein
VSFISPFRSELRMARELADPDEFIEINVDTPIELYEARDPKGLYKLARTGKLPNLTGIGSPHEAPENAEIVLKGAEQAPTDWVEQVMSFLKAKGVVDASCISAFVLRVCSDPESRGQMGLVQLAATALLRTGQVDQARNWADKREIGQIGQS